VGGAAEDEAEQLSFAPATVEAVDELIQVALQVLAAEHGQARAAGRASPLLHGPRHDALVQHLTTPATPLHTLSQSDRHELRFHQVR
jgi:hypothetical protein